MRRWHSRLSAAELEGRECVVMREWDGGSTMLVECVRVDSALTSKLYATISIICNNLQQRATIRNEGESP